MPTRGRSGQWNHDDCLLVAGLMSDLAEQLPDVATLLTALDDASYLADEPLGTALFLAARMGQPILLEGEPGVGKTEAAKALATVLDTPLIRLQCYEGLTSAEALYEWNYPAPAARDPAGRGQGRDAPRGRPVQRRLPAGTAVARGARPSGPAARGAADRRGRPRRRRVRGVPVRAAGRGRGDDPRAGHPAGGLPAGRGADVEPDPRSARRAQAPLPVPLDRVPGHRAGGGDHPPPGARRRRSGWPGRSRAASPPCAAWTWPSRPASRRRSAGPRRWRCWARSELDARSAQQTAGAVLKYAEDLRTARTADFAALVSHDPREG